MTSNKPVSGIRTLLCIGVLLMLLLQGCNLFGSDDKKSTLPPTVFRGYFTISAPVAGASIHLDSTYSILWSPSDSVANGNVRISVFQGDKFLATIASNAANSGSYVWRPSLSTAISGYKLGSGMSLRIRIASALDTTKWDFSQYFTTYSNYSGTIAVTSPSAGALVRMDSTYAIRWTTTGTIGTFMGIQLFKDTVLVATLTSSASISGYHQWSNIDAYLSTYGSGSNYRIRVFSVSDPSITNTSPAFSVVSAYSGSFNITSPATGDSLLAGNTYNILWTTVGNPGTQTVLSLVRDSSQITTLSSLTSPVSGSFSWIPNLGIATANRYRIKITSVNDPGIFSYSGYFTVKGSEPDVYEADDNLSSAKAIAITGETQQHTLTYQDQDWLKFSGTKGKRYLISIRSAISSQYANIYDSSGVSVGISTQTGSNIQSVLLPPYTGKYLVRITSSSGYGPYTVAIAEFDSTQSSFAIKFASPDEAATWAAGSAYTISYTPDSIFYGTTVNLSLYLDSTQSQSITTAISNTGSYSWMIPSGLYTSSRYRIRISSYGNSQIYSFSPYFSISGITPDTFEPDNIKTAAKVISADGVAQAHNLTSGDVDWIRIDVTATKRYLIGIKSPLVSVYASLQDSIGTQIGTQSGVQFQLALTPTYTGSYYIRMSPSSSYGSYSISLVAYDSTQNGFPVKFTAPDTTSTWASGSNYPVSWTADQTLFGSSISLALYLDSTFIQTMTSGSTNSGSYSWSIPTGLVTSGRYRIRISNYSNTTIYGYSPYFAISGLTPDVYEPDNVRSVAKDITTDGVAQLHNITTSDSDWVKFNAVTTKSYLISISSSATMSLYIYDSLGVQINYTSGSKVSLVLNPIRAGKYYVAVRYGFSNGPYSLSVNGFDAGPGGLPAKFTAPIDSAIWAAGSSYSATWTPDTALFGTYLGLALYQDTTLIQSISTSVFNNGTFLVSIPSGLATSSRYRIRMNSSSNSQIFGYSPFFTVSGTPPDVLEPNDSASAAKVIVPGATKQALSLTYRDHDWFKFTAKAQMLYILQATSAYPISTTLRLHSGLGSTVIATNSKTSSLDSVNTIAWVCPTEGIYYASVDPYSTSINGAYSFEIKEVDPASYKFTVSAPVATFIGKNNSAMAIIWSDPSSVKGFVDIFLYDATGVVQTIAANQTNLGSYSWIIPVTMAARSDYYIKVISRLSSAINGTSATFSIAP